jgi:hypothetical protein
MGRVLKIFLAGGIPFGILTGAFYSFRYDLQTGLISGLAAGIVSGLAMSFILGLLHIRAVKKIAPELNEEAYRIHHVRNVRLQMPYDNAFNLCIKSITPVKNCRIREIDRSKGSITAKTPVNWKTWGDTIIFEIAETDNGYTDVKVSSRPTARTTLVDYGKNLDNVEKIISFLEKS